MQIKEIDNFKLSKIRKKEPNPIVMKKNGKMKYDRFTKKFGIIMNGTKVGGLKVNHCNGITTGTYLLEEKKNRY